MKTEDCSKINYEVNDALKRTLLEIVDEFVGVCEMHNLQYFLIGGTLLGAVRHNGFIPWDDDLDIAMPRKDYNKFIEMFNNEESDYFMHCIETDSEYWMPFAKFRKKNTLYDSGSTRGSKSKRGIFIDVFPLDNAKEPNNFAQGFRARIVKILRKVVKSKISLVHSKNNEKRSKYIAKKVIYYISKPITIQILVKGQQNLMTCLNDIDTDYYINLGSQYDYRKQTIRKKMYLPSTKLRFEEKWYQAPCKYDYILRRIYGDYMKLPTVEKRISHNPDNIIFDTRKVE